MCKYYNGGGAERDFNHQGIEVQCAQAPTCMAQWQRGEVHHGLDIQGIMLLRMEQVGMKCLPLGGISLGKFASMNPDQKGSSEKLSAGNRTTVSSVQQLLALCNNPRPEFLSMICCFAGDKCFDLIDIDTTDVQSWARKRKQLERLHGMPPHVAQLCKKMRRS